MEEYHSNGSFFQRDEASSHTAAITWDRFADNDIEVIPWPERLPDMNPMEDLC